MILLNSKNHKIITDDLQAAISLKDRVLGLHKTGSSGSLIFRTRFGIHTFFLKKPIDVIICDQYLNVKAYKKSLKPNKVYVWNPLNDVVIELPEGSIKKGEVILGDTLNIHNPGETW